MRSPENVTKKGSRLHHTAPARLSLSIGSSAERFKNNFLKFAPAECPLFLLRDDA